MSLTNSSDASLSVGKPFLRGFDVPGTLAEIPNWFRHLLALWRPSGTAIEGHDPGLRLAIRDGYLSFYRRGQSVAKVMKTANGYVGSVHTAYLANADFNRGYARIVDDAVVFGKTATKYRGPDHLLEWIAAIDGCRPGTKQPYCGREKIFVDALVGANPDVIDLEMALPSVPNPKNQVRKNAAPRMDLVTLDHSMKGVAQIAFWEAKLMSNGDLRAKDKNEPAVVGQLKVYRDWASDPRHANEVVLAYGNVCRTLVALRGLALSLGDVGSLSPRIQMVGALEASSLDLLLVDRCPRVAIYDDRRGDTWAGGHAQKLSDVAFTQVFNSLSGREVLRLKPAAYRPQIF